MRHPSHDDLAAYALGAIDGREQRSIAKHLRRCERCAEEMRDRLAPAVAVLAESVEQVEPPPELRQALMATVREEAAGADAADASQRPHGRSRLEAFLLRPAAGLATLALVGAGVAGYLIADGDEPSTETIALPNSGLSSAGGTLVVDEDGATLSMHDMPNLEQGDVYQVWVGKGAKVVPSAAFVPHADGTATAAVPEAAGDVDRVMITREARAGLLTPRLNQTVFEARID